MGKSLSEMTLEELWQLFPIILRKHNPEYKKWYFNEKEKIKKAVGVNTIERINHIGSSAVAGLIAKPTVDILLEVDCNSDIDNLKLRLKNAGWILMASENEPDLKMSFNKGYTPDGFAEKVFHLHVRFLGDWDELYFRDYLIIHKEVAKKYGELKQKLERQYKHNRDGYTEAKTEFIKKWTKQARHEFPNRYMP
ncbi:GrpB family protein [Iocasia frigidifontis]|uniref:GrpB family protein n=1 Tax=Iocasia fonsfrigidae TaxID=2682810 RepID=A0A8A7KIS3_9FIRM|nr:MULTISPECIES: GrpB family protein [Halanaerobiaceae]AZO94868.1 GrpB family protein [Halocella sp. SP3-1]QTL97782.1 GrpB family protein [Iocasia fonsfrigidae]